jgi:hypothetical protein
LRLSLRLTRNRRVVPLSRIIPPDGGIFFTPITRIKKILLFNSNSLEIRQINAMF